MGLALFIQSETLRLLMGSISPFMFRVTIESYEFSVIIIPMMTGIGGCPPSFTESPLIFLAEVVWWSHILSVPAYLGSSLPLFLFWIRALLDRVFLAACSSQLGPWIYPASPFLACQVSVERSPVNLIFLPIKEGSIVSCCFKYFLFIFGICKFHY